MGASGVLVRVCFLIWILVCEYFLNCAHLLCECFVYVCYTSIYQLNTLICSHFKISIIISLKVKVLFTQSRPALRNPMDCRLPGSSVHGILQARILEWVAMLFSRGIFPIQGLNLDLLHCRWILYHLSHREVFIAIPLSSISI